MAGPVPMMLGAHAFEALGFGYQDVTRALDTAHAEVPLAGGMNATQWTGPGSDEITIRGVIFSQFGGQASLEGLRQDALSGKPLMLVSGAGSGGVISGYYTVQAINEDRSFHDRAGRPARNAYTIKLRAYSVGPGGAPTSAPGLFSHLQQLLDLF